MKNIKVFLAFLAVLFSATIHAQTTVQIGTGTDVSSITLYSPFYRYSASSSNDYSRSNILLTQAELSTAGVPNGATITKIAFNKANAAAISGSGAILRFFMYNSTATAPLSTSTTWASILATHTMVYENTSQTVPAATGWMDFVFTTPFVYNGGSLEIASDWDVSAISGNPSTDNIAWEYTDGLDDHIIGNVSTSGNPTLAGTTTAYKERPNVQITFTPPSPCTSPPTAGTAIASAASVCSGDPVSLDLTGNSIGTGQTYQWQYSTTSGGTYTDMGTPAATAGLTINPTTTYYYRAAVTCSGNTQYSTPVQITVPSLFPGGTYTINSGIATGGTNFASFTDAVNAITCGIAGPVVFNVVASSGPYNEQITIPNINTTSSTNTVTFNGNGETISFNPSNTNDRAIIKLDGADWITINGLVIEATGTTTTNYGYGVHMLNDADNNTINACTINTTKGLTSDNYGGIVVSGSATSPTTNGSGCQNITITNNTISGGNYGVTLCGTATLVSNSVIANNTITDAYSQNIYLNAENGVLIQSNDISNPTRTVPGTFYGVYLTGTLNTKIDGNKIHDPLGGIPADNGTCYGVFITASDATASEPNIISNNIIYNFIGTGTFSGLHNAGSDNAKYYHNTVVLDDVAATCACDTRAFYQTTVASGIELKNNIFYVTRGGTSDRFGMYFNTATTTFTSDNNLFYIASAGSGTNYVGRLTNPYATLADWQTGVTQDANSIVANPIFQSATDFTPTNNIDNLGTPITAKITY